MPKDIRHLPKRRVNQLINRKIDDSWKAYDIPTVKRIASATDNENIMADNIIAEKNSNIQEPCDLLATNINNCLAQHSTRTDDYQYEGRPLSCIDVIDKWKATQNRQFLLYTGPVVCRRILPADYYRHFLALSVAILILCDTRLCISMNDYANTLVKWFVTEYKKLYGVDYLTHNVHNLIHLSNKVKVFGHLDKFSCFKFENFLSDIKGKIKNAPKPLEQVINRTFEENALPIVKKVQELYPVIQYSNRNFEIKALQFKSFTLTKTKGNYCLLSDSSILIIHDFSIVENIVYIKDNKFIEKKSLSTIPCDLLLFDIYKINNTCASEVVDVRASQVLSKCLMNITYPEINYYVIIPMLQYNY